MRTDAASPVALRTSRKQVWLASALLGLVACTQAPASTPAEPALATERRITLLLVDCPQNQFYDRDLADLAPVLIEKLARGKPDALKRAKEELGALGEAAFPTLAQRFHAEFSDPMRTPFLENTVDALAFNPTDAAHALALEALQHPLESVRGKALDALTRWPRPKDFELVAGRLAIETRELRRKSVATLFASDPVQAEEFLLASMEQDRERDLWLAAAPYLAECRSPDAARRCAELIPKLEPNLAVYLAAGSVRLDENVADTPGDRHLRAELQHTDPQRRLGAFVALQRAGIVARYESGLLADPAVQVRAMVAAGFAKLGTPGPERRAALLAALADPDDSVRAEVLKTLCELGDPEGIEHALAGLDGEGFVLQSALQALRPVTQSDPALARRAFARLMERHALEEHRPVAQRSATFKALAQLPLAEAAEFLHTIGVAAGDETIESLRAHDWLMIQAANTGLPGRTRLAELLRDEHDPLRRIDLIDALGSLRDELARTVLLERVEDSTAAPLERLFAASLLVKIGPSWDVAPRLKRVSYTLQTPAELEARSALQCLLWTWY